MQKSPRNPTTSRLLKRGGVTGIALGVLAIVACELPIILALIGLGGLSSGASAFLPGQMVELAAIAVFVVGAGVLIALCFKGKHIPTQGGPS